MNIIKWVDRYGTSDCVFFVHYEDGNIERFELENVPSYVWDFITKAYLKVMDRYTTNYFYRFLPYGK